MGTCTIESHIGDGEYEVTLHRDEVRLQIIIDHFTARNVLLTTEGIPATEDELELVETTLAETTAAMNLLIEAYRTAWNAWNSDKTDANETARDDALKAVVAATAQYNKDSIPVVEAARRLEVLKQEKIDNAQKIGMAQDRQESAPEIRNIYCVDLADGVQGYDELATGSVFNTIEIDSVGEKILIDSAYPDAFIPTPVDDGLQYVGANTPEGWLYNLIGYPGMLKWKPQYGQGSIKNIDYENNTCTVYRYLTQSSIGIMPEGQNWPYNDVADDITDCPIQYMECNSMAFEVGDLVVLEFLGNKTPTVVGFVNGPKPCGPNVPIQIYDFDDEKFFSLYVDPDGLWYRRNDSGAMCGSSYWTNVTTGTTISCQQHKTVFWSDRPGYYGLPHAGKVYKDGALLVSMPIYDGGSSTQTWSPVAAAQDDTGRVLIAANWGNSPDVGDDIRKKAIYKYENSTLTRIYFEDGQFEWDAAWNQDGDVLYSYAPLSGSTYTVVGDTVTKAAAGGAGGNLYINPQTGAVTEQTITGTGTSVIYGCVWSSAASNRTGEAAQDFGSRKEYQFIVAGSRLGELVVHEEDADRVVESTGGGSYFSLTPPVLKMPSGHFVGIHSLHSIPQMYGVISNQGNLATLVPELAQGHKICLVGFTDGWSFD